MQRLYWRRGLNDYDPLNRAMDFLKLVYELGIILDFDWPSWDEGRELIIKKDFTDLDIETHCKLITAIVRSDRYLVENFENGNILSILINLKTKIELANDYPLNPPEGGLLFLRGMR
jgi:hypothetical protein